MRDLIVYGAGGLGREIAEVVRRINERHYIWNFLGFADDSFRPGPIWRTYKILGGIDFIRDFQGSLDVVLGICVPQVKKKLCEELERLSHVNLPNIIDPTAEITNPAGLGDGTVIFPMCFVSVNVTLGRCVYLNTGAYIAHDSFVGDFSSIMPHSSISGNVHIGEETLIGAGASILQGRTVGARSTVGMGGVVICDVPDGCTVVGNPARTLSPCPIPNPDV